MVGDHCDLEDRFRVVPPSARIRGMYIKSIADVLERAGKGEAYRELLGNKRYSAVRMVSIAEYLVHMAGGGALLTSPETVHVGMQEISQRNALAFAESLLGKTLIRVLARDPERLLRQGVAGHRQSATSGIWELSFPGPRRATLVFRDEYVWIESCLLGAALGTFAMVGISARVRCELTDRFNGAHHIEW